MIYIVYLKNLYPKNPRVLKIRALKSKPPWTYTHKITPHHPKLVGDHLVKKHPLIHALPLRVGGECTTTSPKPK